MRRAVTRHYVVRATIGSSTTSSQDDPYLACAATALNVADTYGSSDMSF